MHEAAKITIVLSTYNRPESLVSAIRSVTIQTYTNWEMLVLGDCCDERTDAAMQEFASDDRIRYINFPYRYGSQAGPNSAGLLFARTPFIALLNHDDLWLADHLEIAISNLEKTHADFFIGRAAFTWDIKEIDQVRRPHFIHASPENRSLKDAFSSDNLLFEPASAWVMRRHVIDQVGTWSEPSKIFRTSMQEWILRAWRAGITTCSDSRITCLKIETHWGNEMASTIYESPSEGIQILFSMSSSLTPDQIRTMILADIDIARAQSDYISMRIPKTLIRSRKMSGKLRNWILQSRLASSLYKVFGFDLYTFMNRITLKKTGKQWRTTLKRRTGESMTESPSVPVLLSYLVEHHHAR